MMALELRSGVTLYFARHGETVANVERRFMGKRLRGWELDHRVRIESIFAALRDVAPSQLADPSLFDFEGLDARRAAAADDTPTGVRVAE
jgi:hypothetical protein